MSLMLSSYRAIVSTPKQRYNIIHFKNKDTKEELGTKIRNVFNIRTYAITTIPCIQIQFNDILW